MNTNTKSISVIYSNEKLRILVEEYVARQKTDFSFSSIWLYVLYWAMEEGKTANDGNTLYESDKLAECDCDRIYHILQ